MTIAVTIHRQSIGLATVVAVSDPGGDAQSAPLQKSEKAVDLRVHPFVNSVLIDEFNAACEFRKYEGGVYGCANGCAGPDHRR